VPNAGVALGASHDLRIVEAEVIEKAIGIVNIPPVPAEQRCRDEA
jgi:hypothetical protein